LLGFRMDDILEILTNTHSVDFEIHNCLFRLNRTKPTKPS